MTYSGLTFDAYTATSIGLDNQAFVNPVTGAFIYHDVNQGLGVVGYEGGLFSGSFLSITVDNRYGPLGQPLSSVADQFNALKNNGPYAGFPTAGYWTASFPAVTPGVPEPATWAMMIMGFGAIGFAIRRRRDVAVRVRFA
ncbi:MAG: PEPxxWA-CTERM sorting domain-containing protein [Proteobacteria bacterium]|nr:PEPxxWA-CTERM sorting domain-containing protein [Pseudomonadota bacterium]